ncbi:MAG TPA: sugar ABC transporter ATP-binding protein [Candidatus Hydrogenedentes bacterium]|nr:sugar ABC transporter ATP-binding protein [Candidatus Hydrogenedentota bacterium]
MPELLLEMTGIGKAFSGQTVLEDVRLDLRAGETHVLAGENGAGKSTLMRILAGIYTEYAGTITLYGRETRFGSPQDAARQGISIIHQELSLIPSMTVSDNIFLAREQAGPAGWLRFHREREACAALLDRLGVPVKPGAPVGAYSIGVQQSIEIAKALAFEARILVMDEPTSALTEPEVERLFEVIASLKRAGCGIIYISHKMEEIYRIADRITVLRDGRYIGTEDRDRLPRETLVKWMIGRPMSEQIFRDAPAPGAPVLELKDFSVPDPAGRPRPAVDRVSFSLRRGEILGLAGLQGSGAEVLVNGLYGVYGRITGGEVRVDGAPYRPGSPAHALRQGIALLSNDRKREGLVPSMSVTHNISLAALPRLSPGGLLREGLERQAAEARKKALNIRVAALTREVATLSGGNQQKVALAKCLEAQPRVLLLNEPTRGVDVGAKHDIYALMNAWTASGIALVLITSEMPELLALSDRILALHQGRVTAAFDRGAATPEAVLAASMGSVKGNDYER